MSDRICLETQNTSVPVTYSIYIHAYLDRLCHYYLQILSSTWNNLSPEVPAVVLKFHPSIWNCFF